MKKIYYAIVENYTGRDALETTSQDCCCSEEGFVLHDSIKEAKESSECMRNAVKIVRLKVDKEYKKLPYITPEERYKKK